MKLGITIFGIVLAMLGLSMMWIGIPYLQQLSTVNSNLVIALHLHDEIMINSIVAIIGIVFLLVGVAGSAYGALSSKKFKQ